MEINMNRVDKLDGGYYLVRFKPERYCGRFELAIYYPSANPKTSFWMLGDEFSDDEFYSIYNFDLFVFICKTSEEFSKRVKNTSGFDKLRLLKR